MSTQNATQRVAVIRNAKFPRTRRVAAYGQLKPSLKSYLTSAKRSEDDLNFVRERLEAKARRETGMKRDEALRCQEALALFQALLPPQKLSRLSLSHPPRNVGFSEGGVRLNVSLDASLTEHKDGQAFSGGMALILAGSDDARANIKVHCETAAGLILWALEKRNMEPLPRLCMSVDIHGQHIQKASASHTRLRARISDSCRESCLKWAEVEPPAGYDGPDWQE